MHTGKNTPNSATEEAPYQLKIVTTGVPNLQDSTHNVTIRYIPGIDGKKGTLTLEITPIFGALLTLDDFQLEDVLDLQEFGSTWFGFTASTGEGTSSDILIHSWEFEFLGKPKAENSYANQEGFSKPIPAGSTASFTVQSVDQFNNPIITCGAHYTAVFKAQDIPVELNDCDQGIYTFTYVPTLAAASEMAILLDGTPIKGSPYALTVAAGPPSASNSFAFEAPGQTGLLNGTAGKPQEFSVQLVDQYQNTIKTTVTQKISGSVTGPEEKSFDSSEATDGVIVLSYTVEKKGDYKLSISFEENNQGVPIKNPEHDIQILACKLKIFDLYTISNLGHHFCNSNY